MSEEIANEIPPIEVNSFEDDLKLFEKTNSEFTPEPVEEVNKKTENNPEAIKVENKIKARMFLGFFCFLMAGFFTYLFNMIKGVKVPVKKMILEDEEVDSLMPYMESPEVMEWVDKLPTWAVASVHIGYMFYEKHSDLEEDYPVIKKNMKENKSEDKKEEAAQ